MGDSPLGPLGKRAGMHVRLHVRFRMGTRDGGGGGERVLQERRPGVSCDVMRIDDGLAIRNVAVASGSKMRDEGARSSVHTLTTLPRQGSPDGRYSVLVNVFFFFCARPIIIYTTVSVHKICTKESRDPQEGRSAATYGIPETCSVDPSSANPTSPRAGGGRRYDGGLIRSSFLHNQRNEHAHHTRLRLRLRARLWCSRLTARVHSINRRKRFVVICKCR